MKIIFVSPWTKTLFGEEKSVPGHPHIGLAYLAAVLKKKKHQVKIFDQPIENDDDKLFRMIREFKPDIIGVSSFSYCYKYTIDLINEIKKITKTPIIVGGPHVSAVRQKVLEKSQADFAMKGEAEISLPKFLKELASDKPDYSSVPNLIWRGKNDVVIENQNSQLIKNLDELPFPDYSEFGLERYSYYKTHTIPIITSRGCPYGCNYCSVQLSMGRGFRPRSPENVLTEIEHWYKMGFVNFEINDDCFSLDINRAEKICDLIIKRKLAVTYQLYNGIRVDKVSLRLLKKMKKSGCVFISYGAESGNQEIIDVIGKSITLKQVKMAVRLTNKAGITNSVNFIIGHPAETRKKALQTLDFARKLPTNFVNIYNVIPYPGTRLYEWIEKHGEWIYHPDYILGNIGSRDLEPVYQTNEFTRKERIKVLKKGFSLYEWTILRFRFGPFFGGVIYALTRPKPIFNAGVKFALGTNFGFRLYSTITGRSRNK